MIHADTFHRRFRSAHAGRLRRAHTLIELIASVAATGILVAGMGSVVMVAARSTNEETLPARQIQAGMAAHDILAELQFAISLNERTTGGVEFTVADRDSDTVVETIRYAWSGTPGDPLTRQYNGGTVVDFLDNVQMFAYSDLVETVADHGVDKYYVYQCDLALQVGADSSARVFVTAKALNAPEVAAP